MKDILFLIVSVSDTNYDDIWTGLKRAKNGNYYWRRSGVQLKHEGVEKSPAWRASQPKKENTKECIIIDIMADDAFHVKGSFWPYSCTANLIGVTLCEIPYTIK